MTLYFIGLGLGNEKDITVNGLEAVKKSDYVYLESYTSKMEASVKTLEEFYGKKIVLADRELVEKKSEEIILEQAREKNVSFLVIGDVFGATTHTDLMMRAKELNIDVEVFHNASILNVIAETGLQLYKFGKTTSIPFEEGTYLPETPYNILKENQSLGAHTLLLLDLRPDLNKYMTVAQAIKQMTKIEEKRNEKVFNEYNKVIGCARLGQSSQKIVYGTVKEVLEMDLGEAPHCLIVPGKLHFAEEDFLKQQDF